MKKALILLVAIVMSNLTFSQSERHENVVLELEKNYNSANYAQIFSAFSPEMQEAMPLEKTVEFFSTLKMLAGKIRSREFIEFKDGTFASYKTGLDSAKFLFNVSVDKNQKIDGFYVLPYQESKFSEKSTVNGLNDLPNEHAEIIFKYVQSFPNKTKVSIALIENGNTRFYGIMKENDTVKSVEMRDKIFEIGSVTKVFTATLLAQAVIDKKISLDDKINPHYSFRFKDNTEMTFKTLANHTSGLERLPSNLDLMKVRASNPYKDYDEKLLNAYLQNELDLISKPGKKYEYSNLGAGLLGHTLGLLNKSDYNTLLKNEVFTKYKMINTHTDRSNIGNNLVKGLDMNGNEVENWDLNALAGAGGILSTVSDLSMFVNAHFDSGNPELALTRKPTFTISSNMKIALGWHIVKTDANTEIYWHNGGTGGYSSSVAMNLENKNAVIILSNVSAFNPDMGNIDKLCFELVKNSGTK